MWQLAGISLIFEDLALLVVNKPAGLATLPDGYDPTLPHIKLLLERQFGRLWVVHRLDKATSGVLLIARSADAHRSLNSQFEQHTVSKVYHALVAGNPEWQEKTVDLPLRSNADRQHRTLVDPQLGKPAITHFMVLERFYHACLLQAIPETGRTHQIRAHLNAVDLAILGDKLYAKPAAPGKKVVGSFMEEEEGLIRMTGGMGLHALSLEITHPLSGERLKFEAPYPQSLLTVLQHLRSSAPSG